MSNFNQLRTGINYLLPFNKYIKSLMFLFQVNPHDRGMGGLDVDRSLKTLSGGEKSFTSISLILSLWNVMYPPFRSELYLKFKTNDFFLIPSAANLYNGYRIPGNCERFSHTHLGNITIKNQIITEVLSFTFFQAIQWSRDGFKLLDFYI